MRASKQNNKLNTRKVFFWTLLALLAVFQSGCSSLQKSPLQETTQEQPSNWPSTVKKIESLKNWKLIGKIGIRTPEDSITAAINQWKQADDAFVIELSSTFFGLGASKLMGTPDFLTIIEAGEDPISSYKPDLLIYEALGFPLPISSLPWWIKGIPAPDTPYDINYNSDGLSATLSQNQWHLSFSKHKLVEGIPLPGKIKLERDNVRIILAVKQWTQL